MRRPAVERLLILRVWTDGDELRARITDDPMSGHRTTIYRSGVHDLREYLADWLIELEDAASGTTRPLRNPRERRRH